MGEPFRIEPQGRPGDYKTYRIQQPVSEKTRIATCQAAGCPNYEFGWRTVIPSLSENANWIRNSSGRRFREDLDNDLSVFTFYPGQQCFTPHHVPDRPQFFSVRAGDHRANLGGLRKHRNGTEWVEDFGEHQDRLKERIERG